MRVAKWAAAIAIAVVGCGLLVALMDETRGVGDFDQPVVLDTDRPVRAVTYCAWNVDHETRLRAEGTADTRLFECNRASLDGDHFTARVMFTTRSGLLRKTQVFHMPHLVVYVEFADGGRACRVVDIPPGLGREAIVVRLR